LAVTVTANVQGKTYGSADPELTYLVTPALVSGDNFSGVLARDAGENIGDYAIIQGSLSLNANYTMNFTGANLTITPLAVTVTADAQSKLYGDPDPTLTYSPVPALIGTDSFTGKLGRDAGDAIGDYAITQGNLALSPNYTLTFVSANLTISKRPITVTADAKSKIIDAADPELTYQVTSGALYFTDAFIGALERDLGETVGDYAIKQGTLALNTNYDLIYVGANLTIFPHPPVTITGRVSTGAATLSYVDGAPKSVIANASGIYTITVPHGWTGTITPSKTGFFFTPANRPYTTPVTANLTAQNFTAGRKISYASNGTYDGWVLESTETSNVGGSLNASATTFNLGDDTAKRQYKAILSFNTSGIPANAVIKSVQLKIKQSGAPVGTNPFTPLGNILVDIRKPYFGTTLGLVAADFQAITTAPKVGTIKNSAPDGWFSTYLTAAGLAQINRTGTTQFRLYFAKDDNNDTLANYLRFFSGNNAINKPTLIITYTLP
jgi:hypothetical protein